MPIDKWVDKDVIYIYTHNGIVFSQPQKEWNNSTCRNMRDLEIIILCEISYMEYKNKSFR